MVSLHKMRERPITWMSLYIMWVDLGKGKDRGQDNTDSEGKKVDGSMKDMSLLCLSLYM